MDLLTTSLLGKLRAAQAFEEAARVVVSYVDGIVRDAVGEDRLTAPPRTIIHVRPGGSYRALAISDGSDADARTLLPSASAWQWVRERDALLCLDLGVAPARDTPVLAAESARHLLDRGATHLYCVPLRAPGRGVQGMISVELSCREAVGRALISDVECARLSMVADIAAPALLGLSAQARPDVGTDALLPVVGETTRPLLALLSTFAQQDETILLLGPTGSGKSRLARWVHAQSDRREAPFETVDLMTAAPDVQMAELFGWRRGAFTGAVDARDGAVTRASGGTLFIDEIDKLSLAAQAGLLQLLDTRTYRVLGDSGAALDADVRFVIGSNVDLHTAVDEGTFREDLLYRINVLPIRLPGLEERRDEVEPWVRYMAARRHAEGASADRVLGIDDDALTLLKAGNWPGNLRQLDNVVRRSYAIALASSDGADVQIDIAHAQAAMAFEHRAGPTRRLPTALQEAARAFVDEAQRRDTDDDPLLLDHALAFRGMVLREALVRLGDKKAVYELFGRGAASASRNQARDFRRDLDRVQGLVDALESDPGRHG